MATISLCMIVKNEENNISRCLDCVKELVDEIIIVDTGSTDRTKEIARLYTDKIYDFDWNDDFSEARNYSFSKATKEYCFWLDADDIITKQEQRSFKSLKDNLSDEINIVLMKYNIAWDENNNPTFAYYRERLIKNNSKNLWNGEIHESINLTGNLLYSDIIIEHRKANQTDPKRNLNIFKKLIAKGKTLTPRMQFYYARELYYNTFYDEAITEFKNFIANDDGWVENKIDATRLLAYCYKYIGKSKLILPTLFKAFEFDEPRAETCCDIAYYFFESKLYHLAIYWYKMALTCIPKINLGGFITLDCYNYIPYIQLCVCYDKLGEQKTAYQYNELAGKCKPNSNSYKLNKIYFEKTLNEGGK